MFSTMQIYPLYRIFGSSRRYTCIFSKQSLQCQFGVSNDLNRVIPGTLGCFYSTHHKKPKLHKHYYEVMGVPDTASQTQIKNAYYRLSKIYHPDVNKDPDGQEKFQELLEAYEILGSVYSRRLYDRGLVVPTHKSEIFKKRRDKEMHEEPVDPLRRRPEKSKSFDFDSWYSQKYSSSLHRHRRRKHYREKEEEIKHTKIQEMKQRENIQEAHRTFAPIYGVLMGALLLAVLFNLPKKNNATVTKEKTTKKRKKQQQQS